MSPRLPATAHSHTRTTPTLRYRHRTYTYTHTHDTFSETLSSVAPAEYLSFCLFSRPVVAYRVVEQKLERVSG